MNQMESFELKITLTKIKNLMDRLNIIEQRKDLMNLNIFQ
jgi:hypothetical protein